LPVLHGVIIQRGSLTTGCIGSRQFLFCFFRLLTSMTCDSPQTTQVRQHRDEWGTEDGPEPGNPGRGWPQLVRRQGGRISPGRWAAGKHSSQVGSGQTAGKFTASIAVDNMWITCAKTALNLCTPWGNAGDAIVRPSRNVVLSWHNAPCALCIDKELKLSTRRAATPVNKPNVYRRYIQS